MKKFVTVSVFSALLMGAASNASAFFWGDDDEWKCWGPYGKIPDCNPYDEWDPRYWMEEMEQQWDDDDYGYGGYGGGPWGGGPMRGGPWGGGYGSPYGYGAPAPGYGYPGGGYGAPVPPVAPQRPAPTPAR